MWPKAQRFLTGSSPSETLPIPTRTIATYPPLFRLQVSDTAPVTSVATRCETTPGEIPHPASRTPSPPQVSRCRNDSTTVVNFPLDAPTTAQTPGTIEVGKPWNDPWVNFPREVAKKLPDSYRQSIEGGSGSFAQLNLSFCGAGVRPWRGCGHHDVLVAEHAGQEPT